MFPVSLDFNVSDMETYEDPDNPGVLRHIKNHSIVVWHNRVKRKDAVIECGRKITNPKTVRFDSFGNPWCPTCYAENQLVDKVDRLGEFRSEPSRK